MSLAASAAPALLSAKRFSALQYSALLSAQIWSQPRDMLAPQALCPIFWLFEPLKTVSETSFPTSIAIVSFGVFTWPPFRAFSNYQHLLCWFLMTFYWTRKLRSRQWMCVALFLAITQMHMLKQKCFFSYHQSMSEFDWPLKQMTCDAGTLDIWTPENTWEN